MTKMFFQTAQTLIRLLIGSSLIRVWSVCHLTIAVLAPFGDNAVLNQS